MLPYFFLFAAFLRARADFAFMALISLAVFALSRLASFVALSLILLASWFALAKISLACVVQLSSAPVILQLFFASLPLRTPSHCG